MNLAMAMDSEVTKNWYALYVSTGFEKNARDGLRERIDRFELQNSFGEILLPISKTREIRKGEEREAEEKMFPGYLFVEMEMNPASWHLVRKTRFINGFIGGHNNDSSEFPHPLSDSEIKSIRERVENVVPITKSRFTQGEQVRIKDGPFAEFDGTIELVNNERERLTISVAVFGRSTPVELDFDQVEKI